MLDPDYHNCKASRVSLSQRFTECFQQGLKFWALHRRFHFSEIDCKKLLPMMDVDGSGLRCALSRGYID